MKQRSVVRRFLVAAGVGALGLGVLQVAAGAGSNLCPGNRVCIYVNSGFGGLMGYRSSGLGLANVSPTNNNEMSSWENKTGANAAWYSDANGQGDCRTMLAHSEASSLSWWDNDEMSSWRTNRGC